MALQDTLGIARAVIVSGGAYGSNPTHLADTLTRFPDRYRGIALVPEDIAPGEIERLARLGVRGLRLFSGSRGGVLPTISEGFAARAAEHGWHVQFYPHGANISDFADRLLAVVEHAPERLVWGSDWPHVNMDGRAMPTTGTSSTSFRSGSWRRVHAA
jgi:predicted TIM-barrel fold metal-dependent hydrolase